jgi:polysaccharide export outer membrane protein
VKIRPKTTFLLAALAATAACSHTRGEYVWARDLPPGSVPDPGYVIGPGDLLAVRVWNDETLGGRAKVRSDGRISLPFLDDVAAAGMSPGELARTLEVRLAGVVNAPRVTVSLEEEKLVAVSVLGEIAKPGLYDLPAGSGVLQALAAAGGTTPWASGDRIFVLRRATTAPARPLRIRFTQDALARAEDRSSSFRLHRGDVVVVE